MISAELARETALGRWPEKRIAVLDSRSTGPELVLCVFSVLSFSFGKRSVLSFLSEKEKKELEKLNADNKDLLNTMKETLPEVGKVEFTGKLTNHPVCLTTKGNISIEMEKVINAMPEGEKIHAETILEVNKDHEIAKKLKELYKENQKEELAKYTKVLYAQARLIEGLPIESPTEISNLVVDIMSKK